MTTQGDLFDFDVENAGTTLLVDADAIQQLEVTPVHVTDSDYPSFTIQATTPLTWKKSNINGLAKDVRINAHLKNLMREHTSFRNWLNTVVACHITYGSLDAIEYPLPDQFIDDYGIDHITVETYSAEALRMPVMNGRRPQPVLSEASVHVLI